MNEVKLTKEYLHQIFDYKDGDLFWKNVPSKNSRLNGMQVGECSKISRYVQVSLNKKKYYVHRIIFMMFHGYMPNAIDHVDGNCRNNAIENLREATLSMNQYNKKMPSHNSSGVKGVYWHKRSQKWMARCGFDKKTYYLGSFEDLSDAETAVIDFRKKMHGEFARVA